MHATGTATGPVSVPDNAPRMANWANAASGCVIVLLCIMVGAATIRADNYFLGDDFGLVHHLHDLPLRRLITYFYSDWTEGIYGSTYDELRPMLAFSYWLDARVYGATNAQGYHVTNLLLHMLNGLLVFAIARSVASRQHAVGLVAGSLFVLLPSQAEPIAWISGRVDSLAAAFYLGAFLCFMQFRLRQRRTWLVASLGLFVCDLYAKQTAITFPLMILAYDAVWGPGFRDLGRGAIRSRYASHMAFWLLTIAYLVLRYVLFGNAVRENLLSLSLVMRFARRQAFYAAQLVPVLGAPSPFTLVLSAAFMLIILAACAWPIVRRPAVHGALIRQVLFFGPVWYAITIAPMAVSYSSARHLYLTTAGLSIALASLMLPDGVRQTSRVRLLRLAAVGTVLALYGITLTSNIRPWIANGLDSGQFARTLPSMLRSLPRGSVVLVGIPTTRENRWFWSWTLPFALQRPFVPEDVYGQFAIVERPFAYCCPADQWWAAKRTMLTMLVNSDAPREVSYITPAPDQRGTLVLSKRALSWPALKLQIEATLGRSIDKRPTEMTEAEAAEVAQILFDTAK